MSWLNRESSWRPAKWTNGKSRVGGHWQFNWASNRFTIVLDSKDGVTGRGRTITVAGDKPEWGNWKLEEL